MKKIPAKASSPSTISSGIALMKRLAAPMAATMIPKPPVKVEYLVVVGDDPKTCPAMRVAARPITTIEKRSYSK